MNRDGRTDMNTGRNCVIAALTHIHVVIRVHFGAQIFRGDVTNNLIGVHV